MAEQAEVRIVLRKKPGGKVELSVWSPSDRRERRSGLTVGPDRASIDRHVIEMKHCLERAGNRVSVVEMA